MITILEKLQSVLLKYVIFGNINYKAAVYLPLTIMFSFLCELFPFSDTYFNNEDNVLNRGFMKIHYIYCSILLLPYATIISYVYSKGRLFDVFKNVIRAIVVLQASQIVRLQFFCEFQAGYNHCSKYTFIYKTELLCTSHGYQWETFKLSGHMFYLFFASLALMEEMRLYKIWQVHVEGINEVKHSNKPFSDIIVFRNFTKAEYFKIEKTVRLLNNFFIIWTILIGFLIILLDFCTLTTLIYFHKVNEKYLGSLFAIGTWYILYKFFFSKLIHEKIALCCDFETSSIKEKRRYDRYQLEAKKEYYFKKINCTSPFLQPNYDIK